MTTTIGNVSIYVADLERSVAFYTASLGLEVLTQIETPHVREALVGSTDGGSCLLLAQASTLDPATTPAGIRKIFLHTDDAVGMFRRLVQAGAPPVGEPTLHTQWGVTLASVEDPDGYVLELGQQHGQTTDDS